MDIRIDSPAIDVALAAIEMLTRIEHTAEETKTLLEQDELNKAEACSQIEGIAVDAWATRLVIDRWLANQKYRV